MGARLAQRLAVRPRRSPAPRSFRRFESQLAPAFNSGRYSLGVIEHFWCAPYARALRPHCDRLVLDLHNIESQLAHSHARALRGIESVAMSRFARAYERLERDWLPQFDILLVASEEDRRRIADLISAHVDKAKVIVYPNALPAEWGKPVTFEPSESETSPPPSCSAAIWNTTEHRSRALVSCPDLAANSRARARRDLDPGRL